MAAAVELRSEMTMPARAATVPHRTNSTSLTRLTRRPAKRAASSPAPIAYTERPNGVACSSTREGDRQRHEEHHRVGDQRAGEVAERAVGPGRGEVGDRLVADDHVGQPAEERQRPDRHRQRRQPEARDQQTVEGAAQRAGDEAQRHDQLERQAAVPQVGHQRAREGHHRGHRQVDLGGDHHERERQRHQGDLREVQRPGGQRVGGEELRGERLADDREQDEQPDQQRLPAAGDGAGAGREVAARRRRRGRGGRGGVSSHDGHSASGGPRRRAGRRGGRRRSPATGGRRSPPAARTPRRAGRSATR